ncbi:hypothetical protein NM208_g9886 [Fusarium decemcellulare]|uniref:Uncharacterized protein n=1 Tax=Fusarium decemcellulare TaxID=57161 RepID=A0ACC1RZV1_9HYPO|nr:hypothetical protein NM208_g9886 [Fusarium decemcellulare]
MVAKFLILQSCIGNVIWCSVADEVGGGSIHCEPQNKSGASLELTNTIPLTIKFEEIEDGVYKQCCTIMLLRTALVLLREDSSAGWCGIGYLYCSAPSCQIEYGPACDANVRPDGPDTADMARPKVGSVPYGEPIYGCNRNGDIALTYDDGPYTYTEDLLDLLQQYNAKATFYITGRNLGKGAINDPATPWPGLIRRMTFWATFRRICAPPYSASSDKTNAWLDELGYHITYFNLDTEGYIHDSPNMIDTSKDIWDNAIEGKDPERNKWLHIEHDPVYQTVYNLTEYMLQSLVRNDFKAVTVGECLDDLKENWYRKGRFYQRLTGAVARVTTARMRARAPRADVRYERASLWRFNGSPR